MQDVDPNMDSLALLQYLNHELFVMIENTVSMDMLARLLSSQLVTRGEKHLLDKNRTYFKLLRQIISQGQQRGEISQAQSTGEICKAFAMFERALMYDWCLCGGDYSLPQYASQMMPLFLRGFREKE